MEKTTKYLASSILGTAFTFICIVVMQNVEIKLSSRDAAMILSPANDSLWEALKLIFWPSMLFFVLQFLLFGRKDADHLPMVAMSVTAGLLSSIALYYVLLGAAGIKAPVIALLFGIIATYTASYLLMREGKLTGNAATVAGGLLYADLIAMFIVFTYEAPAISLFAPM